MISGVKVTTPPGLTPRRPGAGVELWRVSGGASFPRGDTASAGTPCPGRSPRLQPARAGSTSRPRRGGRLPLPKGGVCARGAGSSGDARGRKADEAMTADLPAVQAPEAGGRWPRESGTPAWRVFRVAPNGMLLSPTQATTWRTRTLHATCSKDHPPNDPACRCGIYAVLDPLDLGNMDLGNWRPRPLTAPVFVFARNSYFAHLAVAPVILRGQLTASPHPLDTPSTRRAPSATLAGPIHAPPWLGEAVPARLHARYGLPVLWWLDPIDLRALPRAGSAHESA